MGNWVYIYSKKQFEAHLRQLKDFARIEEYESEEQRRIDKEIEKGNYLNTKYGFQLKECLGPFANWYYQTKENLENLENSDSGDATDIEVVRLPYSAEDIRRDRIFDYGDVILDEFFELNPDLVHFSIGKKAQDNFLKLKKGAQDNLRYLDELKESGKEILEYDARYIFNAICNMPHDEVYIMTIE